MKAASTCIVLSLILGLPISEHFLIKVNIEDNEVEIKNEANATIYGRNIYFLVYSNIQTTL